ncbi:MAG: hypothetical protein ABGZ23_06930 [Fuerstiella sp.]
MSTSENRRDQTELEKALRSTKPWFAENGTTLIYALAAVLAVAAVVVFMQRQSAGDLQASGALLLAATPEEYHDVADRFPETTIGVWARLRQGDRLLDNAVGHMFTDREVAIEEDGELDQAEVAYQRLADRSDVDEQVRERVLIGLARVAEARCDGEKEFTEAAVAAWQRVLDEFPDSIVKKHAEERKAQLDTAESKSFYAWFDKQDPKPVDPGLAPGQPAVPDMPSLHNLTIPESAGSTDGLPAEADNSNDVPAKPEASSETETPEKSDDSTEPAKSESDGDPKPPAESPATPSGEGEAKAGSDATPEPATASEEDAGKESAESTSPETPAEDSKPAAEDGDGDK